MIVRTRIAPSPTGKDVHVGTVAVGLMNYAWAKKNNGRFIIRIEDTDQSRLISGSEEKMLKTLSALGLIADESPLVGGQYGPYRQSQRLEIYKNYAQQLIEKGHAYYCICSPDRLAKMRQEQQSNKQIPKYDRLCLHNQDQVLKRIKTEKIPYVIRLRIPDKKIEFDDIIRGHIIIDGKDIDDQVLVKSDGFPTYHLAVVVDDYLMKITHIIRGEEWLPSTPKHVLLYQAFGWQLPQFVHISLLRNPDRSKLSKRKNPVWTGDYLTTGILPEALLNYLALMGWSHPQGKEIFSLDEYVSVFDLFDIQKTAPVFDPIKLEWMNGEYIRKLKVQSLKLKVIEYIGNKYDEKIVEKTIPLIQERIKKLSDYLPLCQFFFQKPENNEIDLAKYKKLLSMINDQLSTINEREWKADVIGEKMQNLAKQENIKPAEFFMVLRVAITGRKISPPLNESMEILGKQECLERIKKISG